nr:NADH dehydrogenase subunit 6 [Perittopus sp. HL-2012]
MKTFILIMMILSTIITMTSHPLSMGFTLILQTLMISINMNLIIKFSWYSYILVLVMLGGMLVLFMYMASIASNEIMKFSTKMMITLLITSPVFYMMINEEYMLKYNKTNMIIENKQMISMMKLFNTQSMTITIMLALYLLITMIYVISITNIFEGPMRKSNYEKTNSQKSPII